MGINDAQGQMVHGLPVAITTGPYYISLTALCCFPCIELRWPILCVLLHCNYIFCCNCCNTFDLTRLIMFRQHIYFIYRQATARSRCCSSFLDLKQISLHELVPSMTYRCVIIFFTAYCRSCSQFRLIITALII